MLTAAILTGTISAVRSHWKSRALPIIAVAVAALLIRGLRPGALPLAIAGLGTGLAFYVVTSTRRTFAAATIAAVIAVALVIALPAVNAQVVRTLEGTAKTHTGHVFTVGHDYKLLDAGFYVNPQTPAASTLTLTGQQAARYVVRAIGSFIAVPLPWQLQSVRELAYLPEQIAWYILALLLPIGLVAGWRRDRLVTCMLAGYVAPTAIALALTNGNVGTLLRLRGLVVPFLAWISTVGFCAAIETAGPKDTMAVIDNDGRLLGRINLVDATVAAIAIVLIPIAYGTFLLFRSPAPRITSVERVPITQEERRVAGGNRLTAKLKVRGSGFRPMLQASLDETRALGFVFENPNSADVLVGVVPPGPHDLVLFDGVQEVARRPKSVTITSPARQRVAVVGTLIDLDKSTADTLARGAVTPGSTDTIIAALGTAREAPAGHWQRPAEIVMTCDADPNDDGCAVDGVPVTATRLSTLKLTGPSGTALSFVLNEVLPADAPTPASARVRLEAAPEILKLIQTGDRDDTLDQRAAVTEAVGARSLAAVDIKVRLGIDPSPHGWTYRGQAIKAGWHRSHSRPTATWSTARSSMSAMRGR